MDSKNDISKLETDILEEKIIEAMENKKAYDIVVLDIKDFSSIADKFIIATCNSLTHLKAVADEIELKIKKELSLLPLSESGYAENSEWIAIDFLKVIVHLFTTKTREFYNLERIWNMAPKKIIENKDDISVWVFVDLKIDRKESLCLK